MAARVAMPIRRDVVARIQKGPPGLSKAAVRISEKVDVCAGVSFIAEVLGYALVGLRCGGHLPVLLWLADIGSFEELQMRVKFPCLSPPTRFGCQPQGCPIKSARRALECCTRRDRPVFVDEDFGARKIGELGRSCSDEMRAS
jgi:hypothetical protein